MSSITPTGRCLPTQRVRLRASSVSASVGKGPPAYAAVAGSTAKFAGVNLRQTESGIETDMTDYIAKLTFPLEQSWKTFASFRAKLAWLVYARPDVCARVAKLAKVTEQHFRTDAKK
jgi:hypothetical protein